MANSILDSPVLLHPKPWWHPFLSFFLTLYGILVLEWSLQPIVMLFWFEIILMAGAALVRCLFALDGKPFLHNLITRVFWTVAGGVMFIGMLMLAVTFSIKVFDNGMDSQGFAQIPMQVRILVLGYVLGLILHFFANKRFLTAQPISELMSTLMHQFILIAFIMVLTMHLIPSFPELNQSKWVGLSVMVVKFLVDLSFARIKKLKL